MILPSLVSPELIFTRLDPLKTAFKLFKVPYGCLVPVNVDNLLVAGRCVSGDKVSHAAMRNMMACTVTGQVKRESQQEILKGEV
jgi:hypothetical protein